ncbi:hypothetical protein BHM03_00001561 [Ensete ventricosum]|nr:hypothetical protein BHM03_00001561 [Ensete ventricosum]
MIEIARSTKVVDMSWTYAKDATAKFEGVTSDTGDLADVVSHEEVGAMDGRIAGPTKEGCARLAVDRRPFIALHFARTADLTQIRSTPPNCKRTPHYKDNKHGERVRRAHGPEPTSACSANSETKRIY